MKMRKNKYIAIIIALAVLLIIMAVLYFTKPVPINYDKEYLEKHVEKIKSENEMLLKENSYYLNRIKSQNLYIDSLEKLKQKEIIKYVTKEKEIDGMGTDATINDLNRIFTEENIK